MPTLTDTTIALLRNRPISLSLETIAADCKVSVSWLNQLMAGKIRGPSADRIQTLYEYLSKKPLLPANDKK